MTKDEFLKKAEKAHGDKYIYDLVPDNIKSKDKISIICPEHGEFFQTAELHYRPANCPKCGQIKRNKTKTKNTEWFINKASKIHNNKYQYTNTKYIHSDIKVSIICPIHGKFEQNPGSHLTGRGCNKCAIEFSKKNKSLSNEQFILKANKIHDNKYNYSKINYINNHTKITIICPIHGDFKQHPGNHLLGSICPKCRIITIKSKLSTCTNNKNLLNLYPEICKEWSNKNKLKPQTYYSQSNYKVWWKCLKCNFEYKAKIYHRTKLNSSCPKCNFSHGEKKIEQYLIKNNINFKSQYRIKECKNIKQLPFDFGILNKNENLLGLIEYNGQQHYKLEKTGIFSKLENFQKVQKRDKIKQNFCKENQIPLLIIPYTEYNNIEQLLQEFLDTLSKSQDNQLETIKCIA